MYADRYATPTRFSPAGLTAAIAINAVLVAALIFAAPHVLPTPRAPGSIDIYTVPDDPPPPPPEPRPQPRAAKPSTADETLTAPTPRVPVFTDVTVPPVDLAPIPPLPSDRIGHDATTTPAAEPTAAPPLPLVAPSVDPRYADALQPPYPPAERRANREGRVTVRVLIGIDGRVKQIEQVEATSDAFWRATQAQALSRWRFKPGTRGSVPVEAWRTMTLRFVLQDE